MATFLECESSPSSVLAYSANTNLKESMSIVSNSTPPDQAAPKKRSANVKRYDVTGDALRLVARNPSLAVSLFLIQLPLTYLLSQLPADQSLRTYSHINGMYELIVSGFVTFGIYRCAMASERTGQSISLRMVFSEGLPYWGRNFRLTWVLSIYYLGIGILIMFPTVLTFAIADTVSSGDDTISYLVAGLVALAGIILAMPRILRLCLSTAWLADSQHGVRTRAQHAAEEALAMTKGCDLWPLYRAFASMLLGHLALMTLSMVVHFILDQGIEENLAADMMVWADITLSLPYAYLYAFSSTIFAILYLDYSESFQQSKTTLKSAQDNVSC